MTRFFPLGLALALSGALAAVAPDAHARRDGRTFGLGLILGEPTGLSAELLSGGHTAVDFALGLESLDDDEEFYFHLDYLVMPVDLSRGGAVAVPLYLGIGGYLFDHGADFDVADIGVRVPFGLALDFRRAPFQVFGELAVRVLLVTFDHDDAGHDRVDLSGALGFRFFF